jgi:hypothetical protein
MPVQCSWYCLQWGLGHARDSVEVSITCRLETSCVWCASIMICGSSLFEQHAAPLTCTVVDTHALGILVLVGALCSPSSQPVACYQGNDCMCAAMH